MTLVLAHRGATGSWPENTLAAFAEARRLGADGVELDVRRSADGALVVHHDAAVPGVGPVSSARVRDLPEHVPLLGDALAACDGMVVNVELKNEGVDALAAEAAATVVELGWASRVVVSCFDPDCLVAVRRAEPALPLGWLLGPGADAAALLDEAVERGFEGVHPFVASVDAALVDGARRSGLALRTWTVNSDGDLRAMVDLGVDAVITDRPAAALAVARGGPNGGAAPG